MQPLLMQFLFGNPYRHWRLGIAFIAFFIILALGAVPIARQSIAEIASGPVLHAVAYAILSALSFTGLTGSARRKAGRALLIVAVMGGLDEYVQSFFPHRQASLEDWAIDMVAAVMTVALLLIATSKIASKSRQYS